MLDEAAIRNGRIDIKLHIPLPDRAARIEIFKIHTKKFKENASLSDDVDFEKLTEITEGMTGPIYFPLFKMLRVMRWEKLLMQRMKLLARLILHILIF